MSTPTVSIICDVYNHGPYIRQCLEGFVNQQTSFPFEVLVHDDASTDNSAEIIREYEAKYPEIIKPIYQSENKYSKKISIWCNFQFPRIKGKYVAFCEGDDYWTDTLKLAKQVTFLEANPDYTLSYSKAKIYNQVINQFEDYTFGHLVNSYKKLLEDNHIPTPSVCLRTNIINTYIESILKNQNWRIGDYPLWLHAAGCGKIQFINETTCVYRVLPCSASHHKTFIEILNFREEVVSIKKILLEKHKLNVFQKWYILNKTYLSLLELCIEYKNKKGTRKYLSKSFPYDSRSFKKWIFFLQKYIRM